MSDNLVTFLHATMRRRLNDLSKPHNLPELLRQVRLDNGTPLLPVKAETWRLGAIGGDGGNTIAVAAADNWYTLVKLRYARHAQPPFHAADFSAIPLPEAPLPVLTLPTAELTGLDNVQLGPLENVETLPDGYRVTAPLYFGKHSGLPQTITVDGRYLLQQSVCARAGDEVRPTSFATRMPCVHWPTDQINGTGDFSLTVSGLVLVVTLRIQLVGDGTGRSLALVVEAVQPRGDGTEQPRFTLVEDKLTIDDPTDPGCVKNTALKQVWRQNAVDAFNSESAQAALRQQLQNTLNLDDSLRRIGTACTEQLAHVLDSALTPVPPGKLPDGGSEGNNPVDQYLFDRLRLAIADEQSALYPPKILQSVTNPRIEPYTLGEIKLGDIDLDGMGKAEDVTFTDVTVVGASNAVVLPEQAALDAGTLRAKVSMSSLMGRPGIPGPPLTLKGTFRFTMDGDPSPLGRLTVAVRSSALVSALSFSGAELGSLSLTVASLTVEFTDQDLELTVDMGQMTSFVNAALRADSVKEDVRTKLNAALAKDLPQIGAGLSDVVRRAVEEQLDRPDGGRAPGSGEARAGASPSAE